MATKKYCIGTPGQSPRLFVTCDDAFATAQVKTGEVYFYEANYIPAPHQIKADGSGLEPAAMPLALIQAARWIEAKTFRMNKLAAGVTTAKGVVQSDPTSQRVINQFADSAMRFKLNNQVSLLGLFKLTNSTWSVNFTMKDNSIVAHNGDDMIAMAETVNNYVAGCQTASQAVRAAIYAATTADAVAAIDVTKGYPA